MLKNYLTIALRNLLRNKTYSFINIAGLAVGMAVFILMARYILHELSYDKFHENADRIYRVIAVNQGEDQVSEQDYLPMPMQEPLRAFPEVEYLTVAPNQYAQPVKRGTIESNEIGGWADASFFGVFDFPLLYGNPSSALAEPMSIVITEKLAEKFFGVDNPVGQVLTMDQHDYTVTGVLAPIPSNSHMQFDFLVSYASYQVTHPTEWRIFGSMWSTGMNSYIQLAPDVKPDYVAQLISELAAQGARTEDSPFAYPAMADTRTFRLQPLRDIHLHSAGIDGAVRGDIRIMTIFASIALLILLMACVNFMYLSTAIYERRTAEVGIRKVVGASRVHLIHQFMAESIVLSFISVLFALVLVEIGQSPFNRIIGRVQTEGVLSVQTIIILVLVVAAFVGILSGVYPAVVISGRQPEKILRREVQSIKRFSLRQVLITSQFIISIALIACSSLVYSQLRYIREKDKGIDTSNIIAFRRPDITGWYKKAEIVKTDLLQSPAIVSVTAKSGPLWSADDTEFQLPDDPAKKSMELIRVVVDYDFVETLGLRITTGRDFSREFPGDESGAFILNQAAVRALGWDNPIGRQLESGDGVSLVRGNVVGVVEDFHYASLHEAIQPTVLQLTTSEMVYYVVLGRFYVKIRPEESQAALAHIESVWNRHAEGYPFEYTYLDDDIRALYGDDRRFGVIVGSSSALAILIACLGLFGLASLATQRRTKEIGIRKVVGASVAQIVTLLSKEFLVLVLIANVIAWPVAWYAMRRWLQNFAYRIELSWWLFVLAGLLALVIALATVSWQTIRAATANPVEALRYE